MRGEKMFIKNKYSSTLKKIDKFITDDNFKDTLYLLIGSIENLSGCNITLNYHNKCGYINWSSRRNAEDIDLKIIIDEKYIEYIFTTGNNNQQYYGKFYKTKNHAISIINKYNNIKYSSNKIISTNKREISVFNTDLIETFKYIENNNMCYQIIYDTKIPLSNLTSKLINKNTKQRYFRTPQNFLIKLEESLEPNLIDYYIGYNPYKYLDINQNLKPLSKEDYLNYLNNGILDQNLVNNLKFKRLHK